MAYSKKTWNNDEVITKAAMDNIENGVATNDTKNTQQDVKISEIEGKLVKAVAGSKDGLILKKAKRKLKELQEQPINKVLDRENPPLEFRPINRTPMPSSAWKKKN